LDAASGVSLLFHKIELRRDAGKTDLHRPGYRHILAFGAGAKPGQRGPDVLPPGKPIYKNGISLEAARLAVKLAKYNNPSAPIIDPFCGRGTIPVVADSEGCSSVGIDIDAEQCAKARLLAVNHPLVFAGK
jgi:hypothetical protein